MRDQVWFPDTLELACTLSISEDPSLPAPPVLKNTVLLLAWGTSYYLGHKTPSIRGASRDITGRSVKASNMHPKCAAICRVQLLWAERASVMGQHFGTVERDISFQIPSKYDSPCNRGLTTSICTCIKLFRG